MNNNQINFDPITGQPINQNTNIDVVPNQVQIENNQPTPVVQAATTVDTIQSTTLDQPTSTTDSTISTQQQMQNIPTVEQSKQEFIDNTQAISSVKKEEKKEGPNITFIIILFVIIFISILFLFPYLMDLLG